MTTPIRNGLGNVRPYLYGDTGLPRFLVDVFEASELERNDMGPDAFMTELRIGDSVVIVNAGPVPEHVETTRSSMYVYVADVDATYERAIAGGATSVAAPEDKPYQERGGGFKDSFGNTWWVATYLG